MRARGELAVWVEFASSYSYPAAMRVGAAAAAAGLRLRWRVFLLGPIFAAQGWRDSPFNLSPAKGRYMRRDLARICAAEGLPFRMPESFPARSLLAARVALAAGEPDWLGAYVRAVFHRGFGEGRDIADPEVVAGALAEAGAPGDAAGLLAAAERREVKDALRARVAEAEDLGIFGAPSFVVQGRDGHELFWGFDRLHAAIACAARGA